MDRLDDHFDANGLQQIATSAVKRFTEKSHRLLEQARSERSTNDGGAARVVDYTRRWVTWVQAGLPENNLCIRGLNRGSGMHEYLK